MKLVFAHTGQVVELADTGLPPYAIFSHTHDSVDQNLPHPNIISTVGPHHDVGDTPSPHHSSSPSSYTNATLSAAERQQAPHTPLSARQLDQLFRRALQSGVEYIWIDSLCIDRTSTADLDDAVNGSRRRLRNSTICIAYLHDLPAEAPLDNDSLWGRCRYWKRAWTLQELILSPRVEFYDREWNHRGTKNSPKVAAMLSGITSIPPSVLLDSKTLSDIALAVRISWSVGRVAGREEDTAYALVAITGATLPVRYGEGAERAFLRLQEELLRDTRDGSLLAWRSAHDGEVRGLLARSPTEFGHFAPVSGKELQRPWVFNGKVRFSSKGIELQSRVCKGPGCLLISIGQKRQDLGTDNSIAICFREWNGVYVRVAPAAQVSASVMRSWRTIDVARDVDNSDSQSLRSLFNSMPCRLEMAKRGGYDESWRQGHMPRVVQDHEERSALEHEDQDADVKMEDDEALLPLSPQISYTPSNASDGSFVNIASIGSWQPRSEQHPGQHSQSPEDELLPCDLDRHDALFSPESDMGSLTSNSASASASFSGSEWEDNDDRSEVCPSNDEYYEYDDYEEGGQEGEDIDAIATETHSTTTIAADKEASNGLDSLILQSSLREEILKTSYERVCAWIPTVNYIAPPEDRLPPQSRINTTSWFTQPECLAALDCSPSAPKTQQVTVFRPDGYFHLCCPFYAADPHTYRSCLLEGKDLYSIAAVFRHIRRDHMQKPYCALCYQDFDKYEDRDAHMMQLRCKVVDHAPSKGDASRKGVTDAEADRLEETDTQSRDESEAQRWWNIFSALFPAIQAKKKRESASGRGCGPYLRNGPGFAVSLVHDFWATHRKECVSDALEACGHDLGEVNDREGLSALYKSTLKELVIKIFHEHYVEGRAT